jgi:hypothetical protein
VSRARIGAVVAAICLLAVAPVRAAAQVAATGALTGVHVFGYVQLQAEFGDQTDLRFPDNDRIFVRRARLEARGEAFGVWDVKLMLDGSPGLAPRADVPATLVEAYARWRRYPKAVLQIGQYKTPFTYEELHPASQLISLERSLVVDRLKTTRQIGVQLSGVFRDSALTYAVGVFNGTSVNTNVNDNDRFLLLGRLAAMPLRGGSSHRPWRLAVGTAGFTSSDQAVRFGPEFGFDSDLSSPVTDNVFAGKRDGMELDSQLRVGPAELWVEYVAVRFEPENAIPASRFTASGWYGQGSVFLMPRRLQVLLKFETFAPHGTPADDGIDSAVLGVNYYFSRSHDLKLQLGHMLSRREPTRDVEQRLLARLQLMFSVI